MPDFPAPTSVSIIGYIGLAALMAGAYLIGVGLGVTSGRYSDHPKRSISIGIMLIALGILFILPDVREQVHLPIPSISKKAGDVTEATKAVGNIETEEAVAVGERISDTPTPPL